MPPIASEILLSERQKCLLMLVRKALSARLAAMGEVPSGLFSYYSGKLEHGALLSDYDLETLLVLQRRVGQFRRVWEIGAGVGQLTVMMALDGHSVVAVDHDELRYGAMSEVLDVLERFDPVARARVSAVRGTFPDALGAERATVDDAVTALNCAFTAPERHYRAFEAALSQFAFGVVDFPRLFTRTEDRQQWWHRAQSFAGRYRVSVASLAEYWLTEQKRGELFLVQRSTSHGSMRR